MKIEGVHLLEYIDSNDLRGRSMRIYSKDKVVKDYVCNEIFISESKKDVIRGMHFQPFPYGQKKIVTVLSGKIEGVVLDLRKESETFGGYSNLYMDAECRQSLYVPEYCAWGFHALEDKTVLIYNISGEYQKSYDKGIYWNSIGFNWKVEHPLVSERDRQLIYLDEYMENIKNGKNEM